MQSSTMGRFLSEAAHEVRGPHQSVVHARANSNKWADNVPKKCIHLAELSPAPILFNFKLRSHAGIAGASKPRQRLGVDMVEIYTCAEALLSLAEGRLFHSIEDALSLAVNAVRFEQIQPIRRQEPCRAMLRPAGCIPSPLTQSARPPASEPVPQRQIHKRRTSYESAFKLHVVKEALQRPPDNRIKPTCALYPGIEPCQVRRGRHTLGHSRTCPGLLSHSLWSPQPDPPLLTAFSCASGS